MSAEHVEGVQRWEAIADDGIVEPRVDGELVRFEDHQAALAEVQKELDEANRKVGVMGPELEAEYRLRAYADREKENAEKQLADLLQQVEGLAVELERRAAEHRTEAANAPDGSYRDTVGLVSAATWEEAAKLLRESLPVPEADDKSLRGEAVRLRARGTECGVCGVPTLGGVSVCKGYWVPRCPDHRAAPPYQAEARLDTLLSLAPLPVLGQQRVEDGAGSPSRKECRNDHRPPCSSDNDECEWCHGEGALRGPDGKLAEDCPNHPVRKFVCGRCNGECWVSPSDLCPVCGGSGEKPQPDQQVGAGLSGENPDELTERTITINRLDFKVASRLLDQAAKLTPFGCVVDLNDGGSHADVLALFDQGSRFFSAPRRITAAQPDLVEEAGQETVELRALIGEFEGGDGFLFLGAKNHVEYEAICEEDEADQTVNDRWEDLKLEWVERGPAGITDTREVDIALRVPADLFSTPQLSAAVTPDPAGGDGE